ncbi:MAG TPA: sensor histidine kinase, partial [Clostridia bacterium]
LLAQAVTNILTNAVRYARETILVQIHTDAGSACISIQDDGPGIAYEDLPHLFDRFYKGNKGQFGLGLAIAHSAVTAMNGVLTVENASPGGAVFRICLPLVQSVP